MKHSTNTSLIVFHYVLSDSFLFDKMNRIRILMQKKKIKSKLPNSEIMVDGECSVASVVSDSLQPHGL